MLEHIYSKGYGGRFWMRLLCFKVHIWEGLEKVTIGPLTIIKERCVDCGRIQIYVLVEWSKR